jgi:predicted phage terminase large subunit-like protein
LIAQKLISKQYGQHKFTNQKDPRVLVEDVAYQSAAIEQLWDLRVKAGGIKVRGDKHSRLMTAGMLFEMGQVLFPRGEVKQIIQQLVGFGVEKHDDLCDALTLVLNYVQANVDYGIMCMFIGEEPIYSTFFRDKNTKWRRN